MESNRRVEIYARPRHEPPGSGGVPSASREPKTGTRRRDASAPRNCANKKKPPGKFPGGFQFAETTAPTKSRDRAGGSSDEFVDEVLQEFLAAADIAGHFALLEHVGFEVGEIALARLDFRANAGIP